MRDVRRAFEGVSRVRLSVRVGLLLWQSGACYGLSRGARAPRIAALVRERAGAMGRADGARRRAEHRRADRAGWAARATAARGARRRAALEVPRARASARRALRLRGRA